MMLQVEVVILLGVYKPFKETTLVTLKGRISLTLNKEVQTSGETVA